MFTDRIVLDEQDAAELLTVLYNGKPHHVHILICLCGAIADLRVSAKAWNGWQILPHAKCPRCIETRKTETVELYPTRARQRFEIQLTTLHREEIVR